jgi:hypothetical protein
MAIDLHPRVHGLYPLGALNRKWAIFKCTTLTPDDFDNLIGQGTATLVWEDQISRAQHSNAKPAP